MDFTCCSVYQTFHWYFQSCLFGDRKGIWLVWILFRQLWKVPGICVGRDMSVFFILGKLGVTHDLGWWLVGKPMVNFLFVLVELFRCLLRFWSYGAKCVQLGCFRSGVDLFSVKFCLDRIIPISHSWHQKTRGTVLPDGEDCIPPCSVILA